MLPDMDETGTNPPFYPPVDPPSSREDGRIVTFQEVQDRLVEAVRCAWRLPDREQGWLSVRAYWPAFPDEAVEGDGRVIGGTVETKLKPLPLARAEMAAMEEAFGWMRHVREKDRKLVGLAIGKLAAGRSQVPWGELLRPMGVTRGKDALRKRYGRALSSICYAINGSSVRDSAVQPPIIA